TIETYCQKLVQDTLTISLQPDKKMPLVHIPITIDDKRGQSEKFIGKDQTNHYIFIPVDQLIYTKKPLPQEILAHTRFDSLQESSEGLHLTIHYFRISEKAGSLFYPHYQLNAIFSLYRNTTLPKSEYLGDLLYDTYAYKPFFSTNKRKGFSQVLTKWHARFIDDLNKFKKSDSFLYNQTLTNFRASVWSQNPLDMIMGCNVVIGSDFYLTDMQIFFSYQEAGRNFIRSGGYNLRYRNMAQYEAIEIGLSVDRLFFRLNSYLLCTFQSNLMIGLNRWKNMNTVDHTLFDIFLGDISFSQSIQYNPLDKSSFIMGGGIYEELIYNYTDDFKFNLALMLKLGVKL
ncbi:MAG: hypothetical protein P8078_11695, partial [bacterium]